MKNVVWIVILLFAGTMVTAQNETGLYNIRGEEVEISDSVHPFIIFYSPHSCHNCMNDLINYMEKLKHEDVRFRFYVMIPGRDVATMRYITTGLDEFFSKSNMPLVVYDLNKDTNQRYETRYDIRYYPCLFVFDKDGKCHCLNYDTLFKAGLAVNTEELNEIIKEL